MAIAVFILTSPFSNCKFAVHFSHVIWTKARPCTPLLFIWKWITLKLSFILHETSGNVFTSCVRFFKRLRFFSSPGSRSGSIFRRCPVLLKIERIWKPKHNCERQWYVRAQYIHSFSTSNYTKEHKHTKIFKKHTSI